MVASPQLHLCTVEEVGKDTDGEAVVTEDISIIIAGVEEEEAAAGITIGGVEVEAMTTACTPGEEDTITAGAGVTIIITKASIRTAGRAGFIPGCWRTPGRS